MPVYDPADPATWDPSDPVDVAESARRIGLMRGKSLSASYLQRNLSQRDDFAEEFPWPINSGRAWKWGEVLEWFREHRPWTE